jgi:hypothetical protein
MKGKYSHLNESQVVNFAKLARLLLLFSFLIDALAVFFNPLESDQLR